MAEDLAYAVMAVALVLSPLLMFWCDKKGRY